MLGLRAPEILLIIVAIVLLFGATRLPQLARSIGASRRAFKEGLRDGENEPVATSQLRSTPSDSDSEIEAELARRRAVHAASK
jgi:sec-independent protein translocase protein TatA